MRKSSRLKALEECFDLAHDLVLQYCGTATRADGSPEANHYDGMAAGAKAVEMAIQEKIRAAASRKV